MAVDNTARIEGFLDSSSVWQIAEDRVQTRRAIVEALAAVPAAVVDLLFQANRLLVLAPCCDMDSVTYSFRFQASDEGVETCLVVFDHRVEGYEYEKALRIVRRQLALACAKLAGLDAVQADQVARMEAATQQERAN